MVIYTHVKHTGEWFCTFTGNYDCISVYVCYLIRVEKMFFCPYFLNPYDHAYTYGCYVANRCASCISRDWMLVY